MKSIVIRNSSPYESVDLTWEIQNFATLDRFIRTPVLESSKVMPTKLFLEVEKKVTYGINRKSESGFHVYLGRCPMNNIAKTIRIVNPSTLFKKPGEEFAELEGSPSKVKPHYMFGTRRKFMGKKIPFTGDSFVLKFHIDIAGQLETTTSSADLQVSSSIEKKPSLLFGLEAYLQSSVFSDLEIHVGKEVFNVHKVLLATRSPAFKIMFENNLDRSMTIEDIEPSTFKKFLQYIYTGELKDRSYESVKALYSVADKYGVLELQAECREILETHLETNYLWDIMVLSYLHADDALKKKAARVFMHSFDDLNVKDEWKDLIQKYPELAAEVLASINSTYTGGKP